MTIAIEPGGVALAGVTLAGSFDPFGTLQPTLLDASLVFDLTLLVGTTGRTILAAAWDDTPFGVVAPDRGAGFALHETVVQVPPGEEAAAMAMDTGLATPVWFEGRFVLAPDIFPTVVTSDVTRVVIGP